MESGDFTVMIKNNRRTEAVSPVVGVMLMLVVTVIIAAVVSAYAGGMIITGNQKVPTGSFNCKITNGGSWDNSGFVLTVYSVSEPVQTKDLRLTTSWVTSDKESDKAETRIGDTVVTIGLQHDPRGSGNFPKDWNCEIDQYGVVKNMHAPLGYGPGVQNTAADFTKTTILEQCFGNYMLTSGTTLYARPCGYNSSGGYGVSSDKRYIYTAGSKYTEEFMSGKKKDEMSGILGTKWYNLRPGDIVNVKLTHTPTGSVLFEKDVVVE